MDFIERILCQSEGVYLEEKIRELDTGESGHTVLLEDDSCTAEEDALFVFQDDIGVDHFVRKIVTSGWLHRKQESRNWVIPKKRWESVWVNLVVSQTHANPTDQPLLLLYSSRNSPSPVSVFHLENSIILPVNTKDTSLPSSVGFEIRPTNVAQSVPCSARVFLADSKRARDAWVYAISRALLDFEKVRLRLPVEQRNGDSQTVTLDRSSTSQQDTLARPAKLENGGSRSVGGNQKGCLGVVEEGLSKPPPQGDEESVHPVSPPKTKRILPPRPDRKPTSPLHHSRVGLVPPPPPPPNPPPPRRRR